VVARKEEVQVEGQAEAQEEVQENQVEEAVMGAPVVVTMEAVEEMVTMAVEVVVAMADQARTERAVVTEMAEHQVLMVDPQSQVSPEQA
jgi:hypothetical protein